MPVPAQFDQVTVITKANVYFDGNVVSHTVLLPGGAKKTIGLIRPGTYTFNTGAPERMEIVAGTCRVRLKGATGWTTHAAGEHFDVPRDSAFDIEVASGLTEYICSFG